MTQAPSLARWSQFAALIAAVGPSFAINIPTRLAVTYGIGFACLSLCLLHTTLIARSAPRALAPSTLPSRPRS
jgi:hypothetical protein